MLLTLENRHRGIHGNGIQIVGAILSNGPVTLDSATLEGVGSEAADYSIRVLPSKPKLTQAMPIKNPITGQFQTQLLEMEASAYLKATLRSRVNYESATRGLEISVEESEPSNLPIHAAQRRSDLPRNYHPELWTYGPVATDGWQSGRAGERR